MRCIHALSGAVAVAVLVASPVSTARAAQAPRVAVAPPSSLGFSDERLERITTMAQRFVDSETVPGAVLLVQRRGQVAYARAFGWADKEGGRRMTPDAIFRIASQTKALTSVGIMMLVEEGRLQLDEPVGKYLPEFQRTTVAVPRDSGRYEVVPAKRPITIRDLLTHTAGLGYGDGPARDRWADAKIQGWYFAERTEPMAATVARMAALPFDAHPGERFVYGYATDVLGVVIERVSGMSLDAFLRVRLLEPLGMKDTHFYLPPTKRARLTAVYVPRPTGGYDRAPAAGHLHHAQGAYVEGPRTSMSGGAGLLSTASDYARFLQMLLNGGELDGRLLRPRTVALMTTEHIGTLFATAWQLPGNGFGLGFQVLLDPGKAGAYGSPGTFSWGGAYGSAYWVDPGEDLVGVCLQQISSTLCEEFRSLVYQALVDAAPAGR